MRELRRRLRLAWRALSGDLERVVYFDARDCEFVGNTIGGNP